MTPPSLASNGGDNHENDFVQWEQQMLTTDPNDPAPSILYFQMGVDRKHLDLYLHSRRALDSDASLTRHPSFDPDPHVIAVLTFEESLANHVVARYEEYLANETKAEMDAR